jgi:ribosome-associated protein
MKTPLPAADLHFQFIRASGPGGQNVNKVATAAQLRFDLAGTSALPGAVKARLRALAGQRLTIDGTIVITARSHRTQEANRREALERLEALIAAAEVEPKLRRATRPSAGERRRRLESKTQRKRVKQLRGRVGPD